MKNLVFSLVMLMCVSAFSQTANPYVIQHCKDKMTEKEYFFPEKKLICANIEKTKGFTIMPSFKGVDGKLKNNGFICENVNIGTCDENDSLIFLFEDGTKITLISWNKFNCEGKAYFDITQSQIEQLSSKKVDTIRFGNGHSYESLTISLKEDQKDYFVRAYTNNKIIEVDCSE